MVYLALPPEGTYSDVELDYIDLEPPGLLPQDQNSVWGQIRHTLAEHMQGNLVDKLEEWYNNLDPNTVNHDDLPEWEQQVGLPPIPHDYVTGVPDSFRKALILSRFPKGPFTRARRNSLIEQFIKATFGAGVSFDASGVILDASGVPLFADALALPSTYRVYEDIRNFAYQVQILNTITPDTATLLRELKYITPSPTSAGITINNSLSEINDYSLAMRNTQPVGHWPLAGSAADASGYANNGTLTGSPASVASPGLLAATATSGGCYDFDGVDDQISVPNQAWLNPLYGVSLAAWINPDSGALGAPPNKRILYKSGQYELSLSSGNFLPSIVNTTGLHSPAGTYPLTAGTTYFLVVTCDTKEFRVYMNGVLKESQATNGAQLVTTTNLVYIGSRNGSGYFDGRIDEPAIWNYALSQAQITELYNQGIGVIA